MKFKIKAVQHGWMYYEIKAGKEVFKAKFSSVYDPIMKLKRWLKEIEYSALAPISFVYNAEGEYIRFTFVDYLTYGKFIVSDAEKVDKIYFQAKVKASELIETFYNGFLNFYDSPYYNREQWEQEIIGEKIMQLLHTDCEKSAITVLSKMKKNKADEIIFAANPYFDCSIKNKKNIIKDVKYVNKFLFGKLDLKKHTLVFNRSKSLLPDNYNKLDKKNKKKILKKIFKRTNDTMGYDGVSPIKMKSKKIEKLINDFKDGNR